MSKIDTIKAKKAEVDETRERFRVRAEAKRLGFDDLDDYELWAALEQLRKATLDLRAQQRGPAQKITVNQAIGGIAA